MREAYCGISSLSEAKDLADSLSLTLNAWCNGHVAVEAAVSAAKNVRFLTPFGMTALNVGR